MNRLNAIAIIFLDDANRVALWKVENELCLPFSPKAVSTLTALVQEYTTNAIVRWIYTKSVGFDPNATWDIYVAKANVTPDLWWVPGTFCTLPFSETTQEVLKRWLSTDRIRWEQLTEFPMIKI